MLQKYFTVFIACSFHISKQFDGITRHEPYRVIRIIRWDQNGRQTIPAVKARAIQITVLEIMAYYAIDAQELGLWFNLTPRALGTDCSFPHCIIQIEHQSLKRDD